MKQKIKLILLSSFVILQTPLFLHAEMGTICKKRDPSAGNRLTPATSSNDRMTEIRQCNVGCVWGVMSDAGADASSVQFIQAKDALYNRRNRLEDYINSSMFEENLRRAFNDHVAAWRQNEESCRSSIRDNWYNIGQYSERLFNQQCLRFVRSYLEVEIGGTKYRFFMKPEDQSFNPRRDLTGSSPISESDLSQRIQEFKRTLQRELSRCTIAYDLAQGGSDLLRTQPVTLLNRMRQDPAPQPGQSPVPLFSNDEIDALEDHRCQARNDTNCGGASVGAIIGGWVGRQIPWGTSLPRSMNNYRTQPGRQ